MGLLPYTSLCRDPARCHSELQTVTLRDICKNRRCLLNHRLPPSSISPTLHIRPVIDVHLWAEMDESTLCLMEMAINILTSGGEQCSVMRLGGQCSLINDSSQPRSMASCQGGVGSFTEVWSKGRRCSHTRRALGKIGAQR